MRTDLHRDSSQPPSEVGISYPWDESEEVKVDLPDIEEEDPLKEIERENCRGLFEKDLD